MSNSFLKKYGSLVDRALDRNLPKASIRPKILHRAMRYSVFAGGKRLRPILVLLAAEACGGKPSDVLEAACAMELIHTYSLVHDDLPAMDDDDLRRGRLTSHKVFGEAIAVLVGDALLTHAFGLVAKNIKKLNSSSAVSAKIIDSLVKGAGGFGMIGGQVADIQADKGRWKNGQCFEGMTPHSLLQYIHRHKTAALIRTSLEIGAYLSGGNIKDIKALQVFGEKIGLAFQIQDDILDVVGDKKKLGKKGSDHKNDKLTYPRLFGLEPSQLKLTALIQEAHTALKKFGNKANFLHQLADFVIQRES